MGILNPCSWIDDHPQISFGIVKVLGISVPKLLGQPPGWIRQCKLTRMHNGRY